MIKSIPRTSHISKGVNLEEVEAAWEAWNSESGWQPQFSLKSQSDWRKQYAYL